MSQSEELKTAQTLIAAAGDRVQQAAAYKHRNLIFSVGDSVAVSLKKQTLKYSRFLGRIEAIFCIRDFPTPERRFPVVKIRYYFDRHSLSNAYKPFKDQLSENELFLSDVTALVPISLISEIVKVGTLDEYVSNEAEFAKFCEAEYLTDDDKIAPPLTTRDRVCYCKHIDNPDFNYIMCESCKNWFHFLCAGISNTNEGVGINFVCRNCGG